MEQAVQCRISAFKEENKRSLGLMPGIQMEIQLTDKTPIDSVPYPIPVLMYDRTKAEIKRLLDAGIIVDSNLAFASPAFPVAKKNDGVRLVVDYRKLNRKTQKLQFPFPSLWEELRSVPSNVCFSALDLIHRYHQIKLHPDSQKYTAFITPFSHYEYKRVPFGLANAPKFFQRAMRSMLGHLPFTRIFLDVC